MLPYIKPEYRNSLRLSNIHQRIILVRCGCDNELAVLGDQPRPTGPKPRHPGIRKLLLELVEGPEIAIDRAREFSSRHASALRLHPLPELSVVPVPAAVVSYRSRQLGNALENLLDGFLVPFGILNRFVKIGDIGSMVLAVMDFHRHFIDIRFQRIVRIR